MKKNNMGYVYLIHLEKKFHHCQHYIGFAETDVFKRFGKHKTGYGSRLLAAVNKANINYKIVRIWENVERSFERKLKNQKKSSLLCPVCNSKIKIEQLAGIN